MKIIISPAKKMRIDNDILSHRQLPVLIDKTEKLRQYLSECKYDELKKLWACNDDIAALNYERIQSMDLHKNLSPAILSYDGIQYQYMAPQVFNNEYFEYIERHLRIVSGFYGILKPFDGITPYRLEMQARLKTDFCKNLYDYWKDDIYKELVREDNIILNLASNEYSKTVAKYVTPDIRYITCTFGELIEGKVKEKGVYVKMARGEMVRYMSENSIEDVEDIKSFNRLGFRYNDELSDKDKYVFVK